MFNRLVFQIFHFVFRLAVRWRPSRPADLRQRPLRTILVFSAAGIGDTLTDSTAIRALKESFPKARLLVLTHRRRAILARHNPFIDEVLLYHKSLLRFLMLARELRRHRPDVVVVLRGNDPDLWPLAWLASPDAVVSCPIMTRFDFLISHPVSLPEWDRTHGVEQTLQIVRALGADTRDHRLVYKVSDVEKFQTTTWLASEGIDSQSMVIFQVGGGRRSRWRDWPVEHYAALGRMLLHTYHVKLILFGGADLLATSQAIHLRLPADTINLTGRLPLSQAAALLSLARILVSTDTGIMHLGFAVGTDTLALIHCNNPASRVGPHGYGGQHLVAQLEPPPGMPVSKQVPMHLLTPDMVWPKLQLLCERHKLPRRSRNGRQDSRPKP